MPKEASRQPLSMAKMNVDQLRSYTARVQKFTKGEGPLEIRICECCVLVQANR